MSKKNQHQKNSVFIYTSVCCNAPATKEAVIRKEEDRKANKYSEMSLGKWKCSKCGRNAKVTRSKAKEDSNG